ncbi:MAG: crossover junction endodeoxyribonuclease RuvC [Acidimicrobiales bacterium]
MFVLGIDPGLSRCGYGCVVRRGGRESVVEMGVITTPPTMALPERLARLDAQLRSLIDRLTRAGAAPGSPPLAVAVERVFFQVNARTAMAVGQASGLALAAASAAGCLVAQYTPNEVKSAVAGYGSAPKEQVGRMVAALLGLGAPPKPPDVADALAIALCHLAMAPLRSRSDQASAPASTGRVVPPPIRPRVRVAEG